MAKLQLAVGAFGEEVKKLHRKLIKHGLAIPSNQVDRAFFGPATRYAILEWQRSHGLPATGIVDERTDATFEVPPQSPPLQQSPGPVDAARVTRTAPTDIFAREISQSFAQARDAASKRSDARCDRQRDRRTRAVPISIANRLARLLDVLFDA